MDREFKGMRVEVAGRPGMKYRAIELSGGGKRAADVTVALGPSGPDVQQPFICRHGVLVPSAIAEHPSAEIGYVFLLGPQLEGDAGACDGMLTPAPVQQGLAAFLQRHFVRSS